MLADCVGEWRRCGLPTLTGDPARGIVFLLDGVGGYLLTPTTVRRALRQAGAPLASYVFDWHRGLRGDPLLDLVCQRRNRAAALRLARIIRRFGCEYPSASLHLVGYSGGAGLAVFTAERLGSRTRLRTLILGCPALSPGYDLRPALEHVEHCWAFVSRRDWAMLGVGTSLFGTIDRRFGPAAGMRGFGGTNLVPPAVVNFTQVFWQPEMAADGHFGHHVGCAAVAFIRQRIMPLLLDGGP